MTTVSYTHTRNNLAKILQQAEENREAIVVTRSGKNPSVILSMDEYESMQETLYLMSSPKNLERMVQSLADYDAGNFAQRELIEEK